MDPDLPTFICRDKGPEIRHWMQRARETGGFLLLVGDSCVGKTRLLYEMAREVLGDFKVLVPELGDLVNGIANANCRLPKLLVWLDELQRFLDGPYLADGSTSITRNTVSHLLDADTPVIIVGTLWSERATQLRSKEPRDQEVAEGGDQEVAEGDSKPRYPKAFEILEDRRRHEITVLKFSLDERHTAEQLKAKDPRLAEALAVRDLSVTEVLAGARELVRRYEQATEEQQAVLHAAIDARRLGIQAPLTEQLLTAAARGYLTTVHPHDAWFRSTLDELIRRDRATAPLIPVPNRERSTILGYNVADYLLQRLTRRRRSTRISALTWQALIDHTHDQGDLFRLALSADRRLLYCYAEPLYRHLANTGDFYAAHRLADLLVKRQSPDADVTGVFQILIESAASEADLSVQRYYGRLYVNDETCSSIVDRLDKQGRHEAALAIRRAWADAGDKNAATDLRFDTPLLFRRLLIEQNKADDAMTILDAFIEAAGTDAADIMAEELEHNFHTDRVTRFSSDGESTAEGWFDRFIEQGRAVEGLKPLRFLTKAGSWRAARLLADALAMLGDADSLVELRDWADAWKELNPIFSHFDELLATALVEHGDIQELRVRADAGSWPAARRLADLLLDRGNIQELRARADAGDEAAGFQLARLLVDQGDLQELRARAKYGDRAAALWLVELVEQDHVDEAITIVRSLAAAGSWYAQNRLVSLLKQQGNVQEAIILLQTRADAGDEFASTWWAKLMIEQDRIDQVTAIVKALNDAEREVVARKWSDRLVEQNRTEDAVRVLRALADDGDSWAAGRLVDLLLAQNCTEDALDVLRARANDSSWASHHLVNTLIAENRTEDALTVLRTLADTGNEEATHRLAQLLTEQNNVTELRDRADAGDSYAADALASVLAEQGNIEALRDRADAGARQAARRLANLLSERGHLDELRDRADAGDSYAADALASVLAEQGNIKALRDRADAGDSYAADALTRALAEQGNIEELRYRADAGDDLAARLLTDLFLRIGQLDELYRETHAGTPYAARRLIDLLNQNGEAKQAEQIHDLGLNPDGSIATGDRGIHGR